MLRTWGRSGIWFVLHRERELVPWFCDAARCYAGGFGRARVLVRSHQLSPLPNPVWVLWT